MKILVIDPTGAGLDFSLRCQWAGHEVRHFYSPSKRPNVGRGLITRVKDWRQHMKWADFILTTGSDKYAWELEDYYDAGYPIIGAHKDCAKWELDRVVGMEILQQHGIDVVPYQRFDSYDDAIAHVKRTEGVYVCKPIGEADRSLSYVSKGPDDMVSQLKRAARQGSAKQPFILQEKVEGVEVGVGGWFNKKDWVGPWEENFEHKKLMNDEVGVNTGEMGTAMKYVDDSKLADVFLKPLTTTLAAMGYCGNIDVGVMVDKYGRAYPLEFTMRTGWPAFYLQTHMNKGDPAQWLYDLTQGRDSMKCHMDHCIGVYVCGPSFPHSTPQHHEIEGVPFFGINQKNIKNIHLCDAMVGHEEVFEEGIWQDRELFVSAGEYYMVVCGRGPTICDAREEAYSTIKELKIPNSPMYRTDIGKKLKDGLRELKAHGFCKEWVYGNP